MSVCFDLVVRGGTILDGSGSKPFQADIGIVGDRIDAVSADLPKGKQEIDACGRLVTPGFVDIHTHYDGQVTWEDRLVPSTGHGVTTAVIGNCGVGFAPCRAHQRDGLMKLMEGVEDIPNIVLAEGVPWSWETFPEYLDFLGERAFDADVAAYVPHAALRTYVMGNRALANERANADDIAQMSELLANAVAAGALGFGTSQTFFHRSSDGTFTPTLGADEAEYAGLAAGISKAGGGIMQFVVEWTDDWRPRFAMLRRLTERTGLPITFALTQNHSESAVWRDVLAEVSKANADGLDMSVQIIPRPIGVLLGLELTLNPFYTTPTYEQLSSLPLSERLIELKRPEIKEKILSENNSENPLLKLGMRVRDFDQLYEFSDPPNYEPSQESSIGAQARRLGVSADGLVYDKLLKGDGRNILYLAFSNFADFSLEPCREMLSHPRAVLGLGDGGAHMGTICDASIYTYMLTYWARDRECGPKLPVERVVNLLTRAGAEVIGLRDRGLLRPGYRADINVIDWDNLRLGIPYLVRDLPAGGRRLMQDASGYDATILAGKIVRSNDRDTGTRPGRLIRGARPDPIA